MQTISYENGNIPFFNGGHPIQKLNEVYGLVRCYTMQGDSEFQVRGQFNHLEF